MDRELAAVNDALQIIKSAQVAIAASYPSCQFVSEWTAADQGAWYALYHAAAFVRRDYWRRCGKVPQSFAPGYAN